MCNTKGENKLTPHIPMGVRQKTCREGGVGGNVILNSTCEV